MNKAAATFTLIVVLFASSAFAQTAGGDANNALAERLVVQAQTILTQARLKTGQISTPEFHQAAALLDAAVRLDLSEPRFPRLLAEVYGNLGDVKAEVEAWGNYRRLLPDDRVAQSRVIELYLSQIETADGKITYLKDLLTKQTLAPELKAHIAALAVPLLRQRSDEEATAMIHQARQFYPLCEVLWMEYGLLPKDAPDIQRLTALLDLLKANPLQPAPMFETAHFLSRLGLHQEATRFYQDTNLLLLELGQGASEELGVETVANLFRTGQTQTAIQGAEELAGQRFFPDSPEMWFLKLTFQHGNESPDQIRQARNVIERALAAVSTQVNAAATAASQPAEAQTQPTTQPATVAATRASSAPATQASTAPATQQVDTAAVVAIAEKAKSVGNPQLSSALIGALSDSAWLELYYAKEPRRALPFIEALKVLLPAEDVTLSRLTGWYDLLSENLDSARQELSAVSAKDPLSLLGLYVLEAKGGDKQKAAQIAGQLLSEPATGLLSAILFQATKDQPNSPATRPSTDEAKALLAKFPMDWLGIAEPQKKNGPLPTAKFYSLHADPLKVAHQIGEPMLAKVTLSNVGQQDIPIGNGVAGVIQPDLWFDAKLRGGMVQQTYPGLAYDRVMSRTILRPHESINQIIRIDQGDLFTLLQRTPVGALIVDADVVLNPLLSQEGVRLGPGGIFTPFAKIFTRAGEPLSSDAARGKFLDKMRNAPPAQKLQDVDVLSAYVRMAAAPTATQGDKDQAQMFLGVIGEQRQSPDASLAAWASAASAELTDGDQRQRVLDDMAASRAWQSRLLALIETGLLSPDARKQMASRLSQDEDKDVKAFAVATMEAPVTTQPSTAPAGATTQP